MKSWQIIGSPLAPLKFGGVFKCNTLKVLNLLEVDSGDALPVLY